MTCPPADDVRPHANTPTSLLIFRVDSLCISVGHAGTVLVDTVRGWFHLTARWTTPVEFNMHTGCRQWLFCDVDYPREVYTVVLLTTCETIVPPFLAV